MRVRRASFRELDPQDPDERCECGLLLATHPPLPEPLPWSHGRPCGRDPEPGMTWDGRERRNRGPRGPYRRRARL